MTKDEVKARDEQVRKSGYRDFLDRPMTRMAMSMIPASDDKREALITLLEEAYTSGFNSGGASVAILLVEGMLTKKPGAI